METFRVAWKEQSLRRQFRVYLTAMALAIIFGSVASLIPGIWASFVGFVGGFVAGWEIGLRSTRSL